MSPQNFGIYFSIFFVGLWLVVTTVLSTLSGWFGLMQKYPDQPEAATLEIRRQSGIMGFGVNMNFVLNLAVCPSGLRVGMARLFGPFCRNFFVPWRDITVVRRSILFWPIAELRFGKPAVGTLRIWAHTANRVARAASGRWPEAGPFPEERPEVRMRRLFTAWAVLTSAAALFFIVVPLIVLPSGARPPIAVAVLFPAVFFGLAFTIWFFSEKG
jgi:hypothetical protein